MLAASLNAFFCASPIYGSAEDFTSLLDVTVSRKVTPAAKQQVGETRKKRLAQRLAFFRFDLSFGVWKGRAAPFLQRRRPPPVADTGRSCWGSGQQDASDSEADAGSRNPSVPARRNRWCFSGSLLARKRELSSTATALYPAPQARKHSPLTLYL